MILHPCQTVWTVGQLDNGDVITGGSDGRVRIWTRDQARYATPEVREVSVPNTSSLWPRRLMVQAYQSRTTEAMKNYKPTFGGGAGSRQTEPITIDIDIR
jgi:hypothetical protein